LAWVETAVRVKTMVAASPPLMQPACRTEPPGRTVSSARSQSSLSTISRLEGPLWTMPSPCTVTKNSSWAVTRAAEGTAWSTVYDVRRGGSNPTREKMARASPIHALV